MSTIAEIQQAIVTLLRSGYARLRNWLFEYDWQAWNRESEEDVRADRLDALAPEVEQAKTVERQIANIWGRPLDKLHMVISLSHKRISLTHRELEKTVQDDSTHIYGLIAIGYKCIQACNAIHTLCARGFPDQALSLCRGLVEQEANLRFILTVENREEVTERYFDWKKAKAIAQWKAQKEGLHKVGLGPTNEEWDAIDEVRKQLKVKYRGKGRLRNYDEWAIGTRANGSEPIKAFSVPERARQFVHITSDPALLRDTFTDRWHRLNEFVHTTPRSIVESAASNDPKLVVTGPSHLGIDEPAIITGQTMLNISTLLAQIVTDDFSIRENLRIKDLGEKSHRAFYSLLKEVEKVPGSKPRWYATLRLEQKQSLRRP